MDIACFGFDDGIYDRVAIGPEFRQYYATLDRKRTRRRRRRLTLVGLRRLGHSGGGGGLTDEDGRG